MKGHWAISVNGSWRTVFAVNGTDAVLVDYCDYYLGIEMTRMHNPPHPGEVLREYLGETTITAAAVKLRINRVTLNRIVTGVSGISADMAYRLGAAFGTSPEMWAGMQLQYDLYQAGKIKRPRIERMASPL